MADEQKTAAVESKKPEPSKRKKLQMARVARVKQGKARPRVRVMPRDDTMRDLLKHPRAGKFRSSGSMEWPNDTFTKRRLADGSVTLEAPRKSEGNGKENGKENVNPSSRASRETETAAVE
jgi:hypothetical protein